MLILWKTRITFTKKLILLSVFSVTIIVMAIAIIRVVVNTSLDEPVDISWLYLWSFIEMGTGMFNHHHIEHPIFYYQIFLCNLSILKSR